MKNVRKNLGTSTFFQNWPRESERSRRCRCCVDPADSCNVASALRIARYTDTFSLVGKIGLTIKVFLLVE